MNPSLHPETTDLSSAKHTHVPLIPFPTPGVPLVTMVRSSVSHTLTIPSLLIVAKISLFPC